ncbi:hypothetical protein R1flu_025971 [Riccia fluitans]|uniref:Uncharacterized protein n=1 Tax=Riccia fluitans TaxID=41844 RepID=A0ABD1XFE1_9MARC
MVQRLSIQPREDHAMADTAAATQIADPGRYRMRKQLMDPSPEFSERASPPAWMVRRSGRRQLESFKVAVAEEDSRVAVFLEFRIYPSRRDCHRMHPFLALNVRLRGVLQQRLKSPTDVGTKVTPIRSSVPSNTPCLASFLTPLPHDEQTSS